MKQRQYRRGVVPALVLCLSAAAALLVSPAASTQGGRSGPQEIAQVLGSFDRLSLDPAEVLRGARAAGRVKLRTSRGDFDLEVEPFDIRGEGYRAVAAGPGGVMTELPRAPSNSWRGRVSGADDTFVRLVLDGERVEGIVITPSETFFVEPARNLTAGAGAKDFVFYAESSVTAAGGECAADTLAGKVAARAARPGPGANAPRAGATTPTPEEMFAPKPRVDVTTEADFEFFQLSGSNEANTNADILNVMTQVDGIYDAQLGIRVRVIFQRVWTTSADPYTLTDAAGALNEFTDNYDPSFGNASPARDLAHMFTGRELDGSTIGIAWTGVVCDAPDISFGISESKFNDQNPQLTPMQQRVGVTAHEIGHNFGASHTNTNTPNCDSANSLMNASVQPDSSGNNFCQFSRDQITSHVTGSGGECLERLAQQGCSYAVSPPSAFYTVAGGASSVNVAAAAGCAWGVAEGAPWVNFDGPQAGTGSGLTSYVVAPNDGKDGPRRAFVDIGGRQLAISQQGSPACLATAKPIAMQQTWAGTIEATDCVAAQPNRMTAFEDLYTFAARAGQRVRVEMSSTSSPGVDTYLYLFGPDGAIVAENDDIVRGENTNSRIPVADGDFLTLPQTGVYTIAATTFDASSSYVGRGYTVRLSDNSAANSVTLSAASYAVDEAPGAGGLGADGAGFRVVTVTRTGDASGTAAVDYSTTDGTASLRKDYLAAVGTLVFGPNETSKSFPLFAVDDAFREGAETVQITLSNPAGTTLGAFTSATLTVNSNDAADGPSPVRAESFNTPFFVRQQYLDFFSREPDAPGFQFWQNEIESCGADAQCREVKRVNVSAAFFVSIEFQETGYLVYRLFKTAYGDGIRPGMAGTVPLISHGEFLHDTRLIGQGVVVGQGDWQRQLEENKQAFALEFTLRPRFMSAYPLTMTAAQFVDALNQKAGGVLTQAERDQLVAQVNNAPNPSAARASVLRQVAEHPQLRQAEFNRAFVLMEYYGYLRRDPDAQPDNTFDGWKFWLSKLNEFNGNYVQAEMVKAFLTSFEYIDRFGNRQ